MNTLQDFFVIIALLGPAVLAFAALMARLMITQTPIDVRQFAVSASAFSIVTAAICGIIVIDHGMLQSGTIGIQSLGFSIRLDAISAIMLFMIALLGFVIMRFSINYLDGEAGQNNFIGRLAATLACIHLLVMSSNIALLLFAWILTSISLHRLLLFYKERPGAFIAAKKKFFVARFGDFCLLVALAILYMEFGTGDLQEIFKGAQEQKASGQFSSNLEFAAIFLVLAALLKSAQFPTQGWLIEIMETPTPVSALLHAGLLNAGPFLIIRMAQVMDAATIAPMILIGVGGFTALFASASYMTQTSVKTALGYSSVAHMGFSLMLGGLGVYAASMLHLVAHSFYKAHAFLSSGSAVEILKTSKIRTPKRVGSPWRIILGAVLAFILYVVSSAIWGVDLYEEFSVLAVGAIITMGLVLLLTTAFDSKANTNVIIRTIGLAILVLTAFFSLEAGMRYVLTSELPQLSTPGVGKIILTLTVTTAFAAAVLFQVTRHGKAPSHFSQTLAIHLRNGLYVNAFFDKVVGALSMTYVKPQRVERPKILKQPSLERLEVEESAA